MRRRIITALSALALTAASAGLWAAPAGASAVYQGDDWATHSYDGTWFTYCDAEDDNHSVWVGYYYYVNSLSNYTTATPVTYGHCESESLNLGYLVDLRVVEDNPYSGTNFYGPWHGYPVVDN
ncbi:hypothetical protein ACIBCM_06160 [Streptomyces sp. NPDC051018]|uniref:hypothetical protein n=1 Tax=Streptomyces sp. NPDC051018 TaxID=3365639 RepID=UPI0037B0DFC8